MQVLINQLQKIKSNKIIAAMRYMAVLLACAGTLNAWGQADFKLRKKPVIILSSITIGMAVPGYILQTQMPPLSAAQIANASPSSVPAFDRGATHQYSIAAKHLSDFCAITIMGAPLLLNLNKNIYEHRRTYNAMYVQSMLLTGAEVTLVKVLAKRIRPYVYNPNTPVEQKLKTESRFSFFSAHTALTATATFYSAYMFSQYNPTSKWKPYVWAAAATLPAFTGYLRYRAGRHFPTDIISGYIIGAINGILIPRIFKKKN